MITSATKNTTSSGPSAKMLKAYRNQARNIAGTTPTRVRSSDIVISPATSSPGRSGETKMWPRLRDQISSRKEIEKPIWLRSAASHSSTPPSSTPAATLACWPAPRPGRQ
jgi:hypothetical protein